MPGGTVLSVENDAARMEVALKAGLLACPHCDGELRPWGWARRRVLRLVDGVEGHSPRRSRCLSCQRTSVLLADLALVRRVDEAALIGGATPPLGQRLALLLCRRQAGRSPLRPAGGAPGALLVQRRLGPRADQRTTQPA
jgi:hypothetical protein